MAGLGWGLSVFSDKLRCSVVGRVSAAPVLTVSKFLLR